MSEVIHENPLWEYLDNRGVITRGHIAKIFDHGGTDITYMFRSCEDGTVSMCSGSRLKQAKRIWEQCPYVKPIAR